MQKRTWDYISAILIIINGLICISIHEEVFKLLPTICGIVLFIRGSVMMAEGIKAKDYASLEGKKFERSIVVIAVAIGILLRQSEALFMIGVFWGLSGLNKATNYLNEALYYYSRKERFIRPLAKSIVEFILSIILIFDPFSKVAEHIVILGLELTIEGIFELLNICKGKEEII